MTGRERLETILQKKPHDGLAWTTLVDDASLAGFPERLRGDGGLDFYRDLGCDIFLVDGWGTGIGFRSPELRWPEDVRIDWASEGDRTVSTWHARAGTLTAVTRRGHPIKYPVDSIEAVRIYREMWEGATFVMHDDTEALARINTLIGDDGIVTRFWGPSTISRLLETDMGTEHFYYLLHDHEREMEELIALIHERELAAFRCMAAGPWDSVTLCENTSTYYISPPIYRKYNMPHQRDFVDACHAAGKVALLHMCGHVHNILPDIRETGCDGIHALTPPPTGDTPWEDALDVLGEDVIIIGVLDPSIFIVGPKEEIGAALDACLTPRVRRANFVLWAAADGIAVPEERFRAVAEWFDRNGGR